jgi:hypothetical protein
MEKSKLLKIQDACRSGAIHFSKHPPFMEERKNYGILGALQNTHPFM